MLRNFILVTFRNLWKNKIFTLINIIGLGIALSVCIVAFFNHMFNYDFDRNNENFKEIYRVTCFRDMQGREQEYGIVPATLGLEIKKDIPGIKEAARIFRTTSPVKIGVDVFSTRVSYVDPAFLDMFTIKIISGDKNSIQNHGNVLISSKVASNFFGSEYPIGKSLVVVNDANKEFTYTVGGVFEDLPENSSFNFEILSHWDNFMLMWNINDADWKFLATGLFIQVPDKSAISAVNQGLKSYLEVQNRAREDFRINRFNLVPLDDVGESNRVIWSSGFNPSLHPAALIAPSVMALFILLIACFNFANTSIAVFGKRLKEIGLRKTFGGLRSQLVTQFMIETLVICFFAMLTGIVIAEFLVPAYSSLWSYMTLELTFTGYGFFWIFLVLLLLLTGFVSGAFPALHVSSFSPVHVFKGDSPFIKTGYLSIVLLTFQFAISVAALIMGIVFARNSEFQKTVDLGYDRNEIIVVPVTPGDFVLYRNEIRANPKVIKAEGTQNHIGFSNYRRPLKYNDKQIEVDVLDIGPEYAQTVGLRLTEGRFFDEQRAAADRENGSIIVNRRFVNDLGWDKPLGQSVTLYDTTKLTVIGVVEDFYLYGVWQAVEPMMLRIASTDIYNVLAVRTKPEDMAAVLEYTSQKWKELSTNMIFQGRFQNDLMQEGVDINSSITKVNVFLAIVATLLSLIGMYSMVSLDTLKRTKEIGIRKIQGASVPVIMYLIGRKYLAILLVSSVAGSALGFFLSNSLMDSIWDYYITIGAGIMISASLLMVIATLGTISLNVTKAAIRNPVESLRYE